MAWFNTLEVQRLKNDIASRDALIKSLQADLDRMRDEKNEEVIKDVQSSNFVIDWGNMDAFSIERMGDAKEAYTIIGHFLINTNGNRETKEWKFYCSHEQHKTLAEQFAEYIRQNKNSLKVSEYD